MKVDDGLFTIPQTFDKQLDMLSKYLQIVVLDANELLPNDITRMFPCRSVLRKETLPKQRQERISTVTVDEIFRLISSFAFNKQIVPT